MITEEILNILAAIASLNDGVITKKNLEDNNLNTLIGSLIRENKIAALPEGRFLFKDAASLKRYAESLRQDHNFNASNQAYEVYLHLSPDDWKVLVSLFAAYVRYGEFERAYHMFERICQIQRDKTNIIAQNANFYKLAFSKLISLPEDVVQEVKGFSFEDIIDDKIPYKDQKEEVDKIRLAFYQNAFLEASFLANERVRRLRPKVSLQDHVTRNLAQALAERQHEETRHIASLYSASNYQAIVDYYEKLETKTSLAAMQNAFLDLAKALVKCQNKQEITYRYTKTRVNIYNAIADGEYVNAFALMQRKGYAKAPNFSNPKKLLYQMTMQIIDTVEKLSFYADISKIESRLLNGEDIVVYKPNDNSIFASLSRLSSLYPAFFIEKVGSYVIFRKKNPVKKDVLDILTIDELYQDGDYAKAIEEYNKVLVSSSVISIDAVSGLAFCYLALKNIELACFYFELASSICDDRRLLNPYKKLPEIISQNDDFDKKIWPCQKYRFNTIIQIKEIIIIMQSEGISLMEAINYCNLNAMAQCPILLYFAQKAIDSGDRDYAIKLLQKLTLLDVNKKYAYKIAELNAALNPGARN